MFLCLYVNSFNFPKQVPDLKWHVINGKLDSKKQFERAKNAHTLNTRNNWINCLSKKYIFLKYFLHKIKPVFIGSQYIWKTHITDYEISEITRYPYWLTLVLYCENFFYCVIMTFYDIFIWIISFYHCFGKCNTHIATLCISTHKCLYIKFIVRPLFKDNESKLNK